MRAFGYSEDVDLDMNPEYLKGPFLPSGHKLMPTESYRAEMKAKAGQSLIEKLNSGLTTTAKIKVKRNQKQRNDTTS